MLLNQTIQKKNISFWGLLLAIFATILIVNLLEVSFQFLPPIIRSLCLMAIIGVFIWRGYQLIFFQLAAFHYRAIVDDIVFERVVGRSNHAFINVKAKDIVALTLFSNEKVRQHDYFTHSRAKEKLFVLTLKKEDHMRKIVIEPNQEFLDYLQSMVAKNAS